MGSLVYRDGWDICYCPSSGDFYHTKNHGRVTKGDKVTSLDSHGYVRVSRNGKRYLGHRVAFLFMTDKWPAEDVDHINKVRTDNSWENLRSCSRSNNLANQSKTRGTSQYKGVTFYNGKWIAQIGGAGRRYLGRFLCEKEAALAYNYAATKKFGEYASLNQVFD